MFDREISLNKRCLKGNRKEKLGHTVVLTSLQAVPTILTRGTGQTHQCTKGMSKQPGKRSFWPNAAAVTILSRCYLRTAYIPISVVMISTSRPLDTQFILTNRAFYAYYLSKKRVRIIASPLAFRSRLSRAFQPHFSAFSFCKKERYI